MIAGPDLTKLTGDRRLAMFAAGLEVKRSLRQALESKQ